MNQNKKSSGSKSSALGKAKPIKGKISKEKSSKEKSSKEKSSKEKSSKEKSSKEKSSKKPQSSGSKSNSAKKNTGKTKSVAETKEKNPGELKKIATKPRPSPSEHASEQKVGTIMRGNDGGEWIVEQNKSKIKKWVRLIGPIKKINSFDIVSSKAIFSDPSYYSTVEKKRKKYLKLFHELNGVLPGKWNYYVAEFRVLINADHYLVHSSIPLEKISKLKFEKIGTSPVDSGQLSFISSDYFATKEGIPPSEYKKISEKALLKLSIQELWYDTCCFVNKNNKGGKMNGGFVFGTRVGDGNFALYQAKLNGKIVAIKIEI
jgi:hypothetical protein